MELKSGYYRVSVKALVWNEDRTGFLIVQEDNGGWELPGGGLEWGETPQQGLVREITEEMGIKPSLISEQPVTFCTAQKYPPNDIWIAYPIYEVILPHYNFTPSSEVKRLEFVTPQQALEKNCFPVVVHIAKLFS